MKFFIVFLLLFGIALSSYAAQVDSLCFEKVNHLSSKIVEVEKSIAEVKSDTDRVDELNKTRFSDLYVWIGLFVTFVTGGFILVTINANNVAKKQAIEELEKLKNMIENLETKAIGLEAQLNEAETKLKIYGSLKKRENE